MHKRMTKLVLMLGMLLLLNACVTDLQTIHSADGLVVRMLRASVTNIYIIETHGKRLMVDTGDTEDAEAIDKMLRDHSIDPDTIDYIVITHGHADHAGGTRYFKDKYGIKIIAGRGDHALLAKGENDELCPTNTLAVLLKPKYQHAKYRPVEADIWVDKELDLAGFGISGWIKAVPGHTLGTIVMTIQNKAFVGDLMRGGVIWKSDPTVSFYICNEEENARDIKNLLQDSQIDEWYSGHFGPLKVEDIKKKFN